MPANQNDRLGLRFGGICPGICGENIGWLICIAGGEKGTWVTNAGPPG